MVIKGTGDVDLCCGGHPLGAEDGELDANVSAITQMGKRYINADEYLERFRYRITNS
jgi:hypothetical protein